MTHRTGEEKVQADVTPLGELGRFAPEDRDRGVIDEAPKAYKDIEARPGRGYGSIAWHTKKDAVADALVNEVVSTRAEEAAQRFRHGAQQGPVGAASPRPPAPRSANANACRARF